jgi:hypothetical protein
MRILRFALVAAAISAAFVPRQLHGEPPKASTFAPAADLLAQVDFFIARVDESLADPAKFDLAKQSRTLKDAHTLAALGFVLESHDETFPAKASMPALIAAAQSLAKAEANAQAASEALVRIKQARAGESPADPAQRAEKVASLAALMKQVPLIHTRLQRGTRPGRLERGAEESAGQAATLAAMAQAAMLDEEYAKTPEQAAAWAQFCAQMRDAAGEVNSAIHAKDQQRVTAGMSRMLQSCEACHAKFRVP